VNEMKILATLADMSACGYYRIAIPLTELNMHRGHETAITMLMPMDPHDPLYDRDVFIIQRVVQNEIADFVRGPLREAHPDMTVIYELDDLVTDLHPTNEQAWAYYAADGRLDVFKELIGACDAVTTTTATLGKELAELNPNVHVLPNRLPNWAGNLNHNEAGPDRLHRRSVARHRREEPDLRHRADDQPARGQGRVHELRAPMDRRPRDQDAAGHHHEAMDDGLPRLPVVSGGLRHRHRTAAGQPLQPVQERHQGV
jgi:hypothetical protein